MNIRRAGDIREYAITQPITTIGRSKDNNVVLDDDLVSRYHARLEISTDVMYITDLGSSNGTLVNNTEIEPRVPYLLNEDDSISIGSFTLTVHLSTSADKTPVSVAEAESSAVTDESLAFMFPTVPALIVTTSQGTKELPLTQETLTIGRESTNDIVIDDQAVSRNHARLQLSPDGYKITDLGSTNGLTFESTRISEKLLADGDVLWITDSISITYKVPAKVEVPEAEAPAVQEKLDVKGRATLMIGRSEDNDIVLSHPAVSRRHARIVRHDPDGVYIIEDLDSSNGTFINGELIVQPTQLKRGDIIRVGPIKLVYTPETLEKTDESRDLRIDVIHVNQFVGKNVNLLQDISLTVKPHEFVAIVGGSGAGKTTLLKAINAFIPASSGQVLINGDYLYRNRDAHRSQFGYVPQEDIIHKELTVYEALDYSAKLRLPADTMPDDRRRRIDEVLKTLDIAERKDLPIRKLSGGQLKRVSIGVELLTKPGLFCLDEATSGLDPGIESQMMRLLRKLSDQGHTVLIVTHATKNVMLCDQVIFLARGGYLAYYGPPDQALSYFGVDDFDAIYEKLERELTPKAWGEQYLQSAQYRQYVEARLPEEAIVPSEAPKKPPRPGPQSKHISALLQFVILSQRNLNILIRDRVSMILMLLLAPFFGTLFFVFWQPGIFESDGGDPSKGAINLFLLAMVACMMGALSAMREIVKEADIYRRERMVTLKIAPYVLSKLWVAILLAIYQAGVFLLFLKLAGDWPGTSQMVAVYITLMLVILASMLIGLLVSAISRNQNITPLLIVMILVPQMLFGGIIPLSGLGAAGKAISKAMITTWSFESLVTISGMGKDIADDPCWQMSQEKRDELTDADKDGQCNCMGVNVFTNCNFPGIRDYYDPAVDEPEPMKPIEPGEPPPKPGEPPPRPEKPKWSNDPEAAQLQMDNYEEEMDEYKKEVDAWKAKTDEYQEEVEAYQDKVDHYRTEMDKWQTEFIEWKESRARAVKKAEAVIERINDQFGHAFNVKLGSHWGWMAVIMAINIGLILIVMRWRDRVK